MTLPNEIRDWVDKEKREENRKISKILRKLKREKKKKSEEQPELKYILISISGPDRISIKSVRPEELPPGISKKYATEIVDEATGKTYVGFLVYEHQLESLVDIPLIDDFLEKNKYIPLDVRNLYNIKTEELKNELYKSFEIALAGKWARLVYEKGFGFKERGGINLPWWVVILFLVAGAFLFFWISGGFSFLQHPTKHVPTHKPLATTQQTPINSSVATSIQSTNINPTPKPKNVTTIPIQ